MLTREEAFELVSENVTKTNVVYHMLEVEAIMRRLASHMGEDEDLWGLTGLLHDVDYERVGDKWDEHGILAEQILGEGVPEEIITAIKAHNYERTGVVPESKMDKALIACDAISGLIVACALVMPTKKLADVKMKSVKKKFKAKDFAKGVDRERILFCEDVGVPKEEFFEIALEGLRNVAGQIGL